MAKLAGQRPRPAGRGPTKGSWITDVLHRRPAPATASAASNAGSAARSLGRVAARLGQLSLEFDGLALVDVFEQVGVGRG